jgi:hypothetical protein
MFQLSSIFQAAAKNSQIIIFRKGGKVQDSNLFKIRKLSCQFQEFSNIQSLKN